MTCANPAAIGVGNLTNAAPGADCAGLLGVHRMSQGMFRDRKAGFGGVANSGAE